MYINIEYMITESEWGKARASRWTREVEPTVDLFYGDVIININGVALFEQPYHMSVADLACGMAAILNDGFPLRKAAAVFRQADDSLELHFTAGPEEIVIEGEGRKLSSSKDAFVDGARSFVLQFIREAKERVPDVLDWKDLQLLGEFARLSIV
jgi:hypothetical protein